MSGFSDTFLVVHLVQHCTYDTVRSGTSLVKQVMRKELKDLKWHA